MESPSCCVWFLGIALDGDSDSDGLVKLDVMNEVQLSLANTGAGSSAVPGSSYVSSVSVLGSVLLQSLMGSLL